MEAPEPTPDLTPKNDWIRAFLVINFDLEFGQKLTHMYPKIPLLDSEITNLCFLSFPETTTLEDKDTIYSFRMPRHGPVENKRKKFFYGCVLFRQRRDETISRGYLQKSVLLLSMRPFDALFKSIIGIVVPLYFDSGDIVLERAFQQISQWPSLRSPPPVPSLELLLLENLLDFDTSILDKVAPISSMEIATGKLHGNRRDFTFIQRFPLFSLNYGFFGS